MRIEEKLLVLRKQNRLSQQEMAEELYVSRQTISKWESGISAPSTENLISIGKLFKVPINTLVDDELSLEPHSTSCKARGRPHEAVTSLRMKSVGIVICILIFLVGIFLGTRLSNQDKQESGIIQPDPMENLVKVDVDSSQVDSFSTEPLQP